MIPIFTSNQLRATQQNVLFPVPVFPRARFRVFTVPEAATTMFTNGVALEDLDHIKYAFQWSILQ